MPALLGELVERQYFFSSVQANLKGKLQEFCSPSFCESFATLVQQTSSDMSQNLCSYDFELTKCLNILTEEETYVPTLLVSLGASPDDFWVPQRDTSGCASHTSPDKAFESAFMEFLERQNLTASWLLDKACYRIQLTSRDNLSATLKPLVTLFEEYGDLYVVNTSLHFSCYAIVVIFIAKSDKEHVRFSIGSSCSRDPQKALEKAFLEMCQSFTLMAEVHSRKDPLAYAQHRSQYDKLTRNFCDANTRDTLADFPYLQDPTLSSMTFSKYWDLPVIEVSQLLEEIRPLTENFFYYTASIQLLDQMCFFGRVVSPDFFITMDNTRSFNLKNRFSETLGIQQNKEKPLPFA
jgi:hypothetical protein